MNFIFILLCLPLSIFGQYVWSEPNMLSNPSSYNCMSPQIILDKTGVLHAIWGHCYNYGSYSDPVAIEYTKSEDNGLSWSSPVVISPTNRQVESPKIVCDSNNNLHIVYYTLDGLNLYYMNNVGGSWSNAQSTGCTTFSGIKFTIDGNDKLYLFYNIASNANYITKELNGIWSTPSAMTQNMVVNVIYPYGDFLYVGGAIKDNDYNNKANITRMNIYSGIWESLQDVSFGKFDTSISSIDISSDNKIHLLYLYGTFSQTEMKYFTMDKDFNNISPIDSISYGTYYSEIKIDSNNMPNIFERSTNSINLLYKSIDWHQEIIIESNSYYEKLNSLYNGIDRYFIIYHNNHQVYFQTALQTSIEDNKTILVKEYQIENIYPNPFNNETKIIFTLKKDAFVILDLYNAQGQKIKTIAEKKYRKGRMEYVFNSDGLTSGSYYCRMTVDDKFVDSKELLYLK